MPAVPSGAPGHRRGGLLLALPAGALRVRVQREGFTPSVQIVQVSPDRTAAIAVELAVAMLADEVTVRAPSAPPTRSRGATRTDTPLIETPQAVAVIPAERI